MKKRVDLLFLAFFASGFSGLIYESVWAHYVKLFLGHAAYAQTLVLVIFIGGLAAGAALCARFAERIRNPLRMRPCRRTSPPFSGTRLSVTRPRE